MHSPLVLSLLSSTCRVRPLSESLNDLFREVSLLHRRITELSHRLATLEPFLRHHGYRDEVDVQVEGGPALDPESLRAELQSVARNSSRTGVRGTPLRGSRVVRRRRVRVLNGVMLDHSDR